MNWTVLWLPSAEQDLASVWLNASDRNAVAAAADELDRRLQRDPLTVGESRSSNVRLAFVPPLVALFRVDPATQTVFVMRVSRSGRS